MSEQLYKQLLELALDPFTNQVELMEQLRELFAAASQTYHNVQERLHE